MRGSGSRVFSPFRIADLDPLTGSKVHDAEYRAAKKDWETFVESLSEKIMEQDATIPELPAKDLV